MNIQTIVQRKQPRQQFSAGHPADYLAGGASGGAQAVVGKSVALECQVSKLVNSDTCSRPTTRRATTGGPSTAAVEKAIAVQSGTSFTTLTLLPIHPIDSLASRRLCAHPY